MKIKLLIIFLLAMVLRSYSQLPTNPFEIENILVTACSHNFPNNFEGLNEMVTIRLGPNPIDMNNLNVKWATVTIGWHGIVAAPLKTDSLNNTITNGCGKLIEPPAGIVPAYARVLLCTSYDIQVYANSFANLQDTLYIIYSNDTTHQGHFKNYGTTPPLMRYFKMWVNVPSFYQDSVAYDISLLSTTDGAAVLYDFPGNPTYANLGCNVPYFPPTASVVVSANPGTTVCQGTSITFTATPTNGGATPTYQWMLNGSPISGATTSTYTTSSLANGNTISCVLTSSKVCVTGSPATSAVSTITIYLPPSVSSQPVNQTICEGANTSFAVTATGTGLTYQWQISTDGGSTWNNVTNTPPFSGATTNTLSVTNADSTLNTNLFQCIITGTCSPVTTSNSAQLSLNPAPSVTTEPTGTSVCSGSITSFSMTAGGSGLSYQWVVSTDGGSTWNNVPALSPYSGSTSNTLNINPASAGMNGYIYHCIVSSSCTSIKDTTIDVTLIISPNPTANAGSNVAICTGNSTSLNASGGDTYAWSPSTGLSSTSVNNPNASPASTTTYVVTVTSSATGCSATDDITVTVNNLPNANAGNDVSVCPGASTTLNASGGTNYSWSPATGLSTTTTSNPVATPASLTTYTVTVTDANGCSNTDDVIVSLYTLPNANAGNDVSICPGSSTTLNASGGTAYSWSPATGLSTTSVNNPVASPSSQTTYSITVTDANGCSNTDDVTVSLYPLPPIDAGNGASLCPGNSFQLNASGGINYSWSPSTGLNSTSISNPTASPANTTTYVVTGIDANGCSNTDDVTVTVFPPLNVNLGNDTAICVGSTMTITATGGVYYLWNDGESSSSIIVSPSPSGPYCVSVTDVNGCTDSDCILILEIPNTIIDITSDPENGSGYIGQTIIFTVSPTTLNNYNFYVDSTLVQSGSNNTYTSTSLHDGQIIYVIASNNVCAYAMDNIIIDLNPIPNAFTPRNNDGVNDVFLKGLDITILNRWGQKLYEGKDGWNGKYNGTFVSKGTYYYIIRTKDVNGNSVELKGSVTIVN